MPAEPILARRVVHFADILEAHWPAYVASARGPIPARHWRAVEAALSCRTPRRGGERVHCARCERDYFLYHSCNHRNCPRCGARDQERWAARQEARLLPVDYHLITVTVPDDLRRLMLAYPEELYPIFFEQSVAALRELCADPRYLGGDIGLIAVLHTWTRRLMHHPHLHLLLPAVGLVKGGCDLAHPRKEGYLIPERALAALIRKGFERRLGELHPFLASRIDLSVRSPRWIVQCQNAGRGRSALRYLAAYVKKSGFSDERLVGWDAMGRVRLRYKDSGDRQWKEEALTPVELIRRWLLHVLPRGMVRIRHYGWLSPAAHKAYRRIRFMLGLGPARMPLEERPTVQCPCCQGHVDRLNRMGPVRGPPLSRVGIPSEAA